MRLLVWQQITQRLAVFSVVLPTPRTIFCRNFFPLLTCVNILKTTSRVASVHRVFTKNPVGLFEGRRRFPFTKWSSSLAQTAMPPKAKKAATAKAPKAEKGDKPEKKAKASKKGSGEGNDAAPKIPSRSSKRNADKVAVSYKEVAENVDERASEGSRPKPKVATKAKRAKVDSASDATDESSEEADSESEKPKKKRSPPKKRLAVKRSEARITKPPPDDDEDEEEEKEEEKKEADAVEESEEKEEAPPAKKAKTEAAESEPMNKTSTDFKALDFKSDKSTSDGKLWNFKISSWNICGLKTWVKKGALEYIRHEDPDIFCLQETRCSEGNVPPAAKLEGYHAYWLAGEKEGYAGCGIYSKQRPLNVTYGLGEAEHDSEGRLITAEFDSFYLVNAYVPNAGRKLVTLPKRLKWDPTLRAYLKKLEASKPVILCGDLNVAHQPIDLANPKSNTKSAGFTQEERDGFTELLKEGFVDSFRSLYPERTGAYTFWTYMMNSRARNVGWRLDYFVLSEKLMSQVCDNIIRSEVFGSDHCPITLLMHV